MVAAIGSFHLYSWSINFACCSSIAGALRPVFAKQKFNFVSAGRVRADVKVVAPKAEQPNAIIDALTKVALRIGKWSAKCDFCGEGDDKPQATYKVHDIMDKISAHLEKKLKDPVATWDIYLSKYAMNYHKPVCACKPKARKKK